MTGADVVGVDWQTDAGEARRTAGGRRWSRSRATWTPRWLYADPAVIRERTHAMLDAFGGARSHVANLGHGILPDVPVAECQALRRGGQGMAAPVTGAFARVAALDRIASRARRPSIFPRWTGRLLSGGSVAAARRRGRRQPRSERGRDLREVRRQPLGVEGVMPPQMAQRLGARAGGEAESAFFVAGMSIVAHPRNPQGADGPSQRALLRDRRARRHGGRRLVRRRHRSHPDLSVPRGRGPLPPHAKGDCRPPPSVLSSSLQGLVRQLFRQPRIGARNAAGSAAFSSITCARGTAVWLKTGCSISCSTWAGRYRLLTARSSSDGGERGMVSGSAASSLPGGAAMSSSTWCTIGARCSVFRPTPGSRACS